MMSKIVSWRVAHSPIKHFDIILTASAIKSICAEANYLGNTSIAALVIIGTKKIKTNDLTWKHVLLFLQVYSVVRKSNWDARAVWSVHFELEKYYY